MIIRSKIVSDIFQLQAWNTTSTADSMVYRNAISTVGDQISKWVEVDTVLPLCNQHIQFTRRQQQYGRR